MKAWKLENAAKLRAAEQEYYRRNAEEIRKRKLADYHRDAENARARNRAWKAENAEKVSAAAAVWRESHSEKIKSFRQAYYAKNRQKYLAHATARRAAKARATPIWFDEFMQWAVEEAYHLAAVRKQTLGGDWHVDHIIPLRGKTVCGLHVPTNLQVIPARENLRKKNKFLTAS